MYPIEPVVNLWKVSFVSHAHRHLLAFFARCWTIDWTMSSVVEEKNAVRLRKLQQDHRIIMHGCRRSVCVRLECSIAKENEETVGWEANKSVCYCLQCDPGGVSVTVFFTMSGRNKVERFSWHSKRFLESYFIICRPDQFPPSCISDTATTTSVTPKIFIFA